MSGCPCPVPTVEQVPRVYYPSASERTERKKVATCAVVTGRPLTGEERVLRLKAKIAGNCCDPSGGCPWPANWVTK